MSKDRSVFGSLKWIAIVLPAAFLMNCAPGTGNPVPEPGAKPNFIILFCDDVGYGDIGAFGHPTIRTPQLDRLATEGQRWTNFYVAAPVCTPSRAGLLTGRFPVRTGMASNRRGVLFPDSAGGLPTSEVTIAEVLKERGYATGCIGKWHLGHLPQYLPTNNGFDSYFGLPYSNDMDRVPDSPRGRAAFLAPRIEYWNVPLMRGTEIIERPAEQHTLTKRYTEEAVRFIDANQGKPFFLYLAYSMAHVPLFASRDFEGRSLRGLYGDVMEEIDWSVGQIVGKLQELKLDSNTVVLFTSDNGPWLPYDEQGGSAGLLRGGKGETYEGGMREPTIFWGPGNVKPGVVAEMGSTLDVLPTFAALAGATTPADRVLDGSDLTPVLKGTGRTPRQTMFFYRGTDLFAVRKGAFKAHFFTQSGYGEDAPLKHDPPLLYNLDQDPSEKYDVAEKHPEVVQELTRLAQEFSAGVEPVPNQLELVASPAAD